MNTNREVPEADEQDLRKEEAYRRFGTRKPKCVKPGCDVTDWRMLTGDTPDTILCYEHACEHQGRPTNELQHVIGCKVDNELAVSIPGNAHRYLDSRKGEWPAKTRVNPEGSPTLKAAAYIRAAIDWLMFLIEHLLAKVVGFLESQDAALTASHGPRYWVELGFADPFGSRN
jgi:hypothetical protein